jgi:hypothetical protein
MKSSEQFIRQRELEQEDKKTRDQKNHSRLEYILNKSKKINQSCQSSQQTTVSQEN